MILRPYQQEALDRVHADYADGKRSSMVVMATGLGKTVIAAHLIDEYVKRGRVMVVAHREELIFQASRTIADVTGILPQIEMGARHAGYYDFESSPRIVVSTVQTQCSQSRGACRMTRFNPSEFSLLWIDEFHHAVADSYRRVIQHYGANPDLRIFGVTATPDRADAEALGQVCESCAYRYEIDGGIKDGWLVPITQTIVNVEDFDFSGIKTTAGDLNAGQLAELMERERSCHEVAGPVLEMCHGKTLIFTVSIAQAQMTAEILNRHQPHSAEYVSGKTDEGERRAILKAYARGDFKYLVNCSVFLEGYDEPGIQNIVVARPTKSRALYAQMIGRGTRTLPGLVDGIPSAEERRDLISVSEKPRLNVYDFRGNAGRHKLICTIDVLSGNYSQEALEEVIRQADSGVDVLAALERAKQVAAEREKQREAERIKREAEAERKRHIRAQNYKYQTKVVDAFNVFDLPVPVEYERDASRVATLRQVEVLTKFGIPHAESLTSRQASAIITECIRRREKRLCSYKQARQIKRYGINPETITAGMAGKMMGIIVAGGFRVTPEIRDSLLALTRATPTKDADGWISAG